mmetsp:Transcript_16014/g.35633  ORF Transcript_16014/g.35633 Transcript_16014/m.35633 type:complete len:116 (-) Transcript_16014:64-411(-)
MRHGLARHVFRAATARGRRWCTAGGDYCCGELLGVARADLEGISMDDLRKLYLKAAQTHHPDVEGGDTHRFQALQRCVDDLADDQGQPRFAKEDWAWFGYDCARTGPVSFKRKEK